MFYALFLNWETKLAHIFLLVFHFCWTIGRNTVHFHWEWIKTALNCKNASKMFYNLDLFECLKCQTLIYCRPPVPLSFSLKIFHLKSNHEIDCCSVVFNIDYYKIIDKPNNSYKKWKNLTFEEIFSKMNCCYNDMSMIHIKYKT